MGADGSHSAWRWIGRFLSLCGLLFVAWRAWSLRTDLAQALAGPGVRTAFILAIGVFLLDNVILASIWGGLLRVCGATKFAMRTTLWLYAQTQIAKYLPGNIMHFAGRHAAARSRGVAHAPLAAAAMMEFGGLIAAAGGVALIGLSLSAGDGQRTVMVRLAVISLIVLLGLSALICLVPRTAVFRRLGGGVLVPIVVARGLSVAILGYVVFFLIGGMSCILLANALSGDGFHGSGSILFAYAVSWIMGFITPGAPGGLGVREAALSGLLTAQLGAAPAVLAALLFRGVTVGADVLFYAGSFVWTPMNERRNLPCEERLGL
ncbi:MAG TPA: hypothetical protein PKM67_08755 [Kiritimatiellia bacterium]|nr:hypothetical protein [Kiritimatiellia bacterium]